MQRYAIIITGAPSSDSTIATEAKLWSSFLASKCGGAWRSDEVIEVEGAGRNEVLAAVANCKTADYSLVVYLGTGKTVKTDVPWRELALQLVGGETVTEREMNTGTPRFASFYNCSHDAVTTDSSFGKGVEFPEGKTGEAEVRDSFEAAVDAAEMGRGSILAEKGGISASLELISAVAEWCKTNSGTLTFPKAVELANRDTKNVEYRGGRRLRHFPLAVGVA